jgi:hypothetical protein
MANTIWKEVFLIMCSGSRENARNTERFSLSLRITDDYALQMLCGEQHNVYNDDEKLMGLPLNRALRDEHGEAYDVIAGTFLVVGLGEEDFASLTPELAEKFEKQFHQPESFIPLGRRMLVVPVPDEAMRTDEKKAAPRQSAEHDR